MLTNAVHAGGMIYLPGTSATDGSGAIAGRGDLGAQTRHVLERMRATLTESGSSLDQVVAVMVYLTSASAFQAMNDAYRSFWPKDLPTRTTLITELATPGALVEMSMIAVPSGAERTIVQPSGWRTSPNPYSYAIRTGDTLFLSGLVARHGRDNTVVTGDAATQTNVILDNAGELLSAAGMTHANIVSARIYLTEVEIFQQMNGAYRPYFPADPPARATVQTGLASSQFSVEMTFVASSADRAVVTDGRPLNPNLSTGIRAGQRLYLSGALGNSPATAGDVAAQTRETLLKLGAALTASGCTPADVAETLVYVTDLGMLPAVDPKYHAFFGPHAPARTTVQSGLMAPDGLVEIMLTAVQR